MSVGRFEISGIRSSTGYRSVCAAAASIVARGEADEPSLSQSFKSDPKIDIRGFVKWQLAQINADQTDFLYQP